MNPSPQRQEGENNGISYSDATIPSHKQGIEAYSIWFAQQPQDTQAKLLAQGLGPEAREGDGNYTFEVKADHQAFSYEDHFI